MRPVDVDDVERDGDARRSPRLGHELIGDQVRWHLIEDAGHFERKRPVASKLSGRSERHRGDPALGRYGLTRPRSGRAVGKRLFERLARGEVAVQHRAPDAGSGGDLDHADAPIAG